MINIMKIMLTTNVVMLHRSVIKERRDCCLATLQSLIAEHFLVDGNG